MICQRYGTHAAGAVERALEGIGELDLSCRCSDGWAKSTV